MMKDCSRLVAEQLHHCADSSSLLDGLRLLVSLLSEALVETTAPSPATELAPWYVTATERYLQDNFRSPLCISALADSVGVSARTLHDGFRKYRRSSPMQYLRELRMGAVREELLRPQATTSVTDSALKWGFNHLGRFSSYYLERFGELPSETLSLARGSRPISLAATA